MAQPKATEFARPLITEHLNRHHPNCPEDVKTLVVETLVQRKWKTPITLGKAVGVVMTAHVRHQFTEYDAVLRLPGLTRQEALAFVSEEVFQTIRKWRAKKVHYSSKI